MSQFKKRHSNSAQALQALKGSAGILLLGVVAFLAAKGAWEMYGKFAEAAAARDSAQAHLIELESRYASVKASVDSLESPRGVEAVVRERYGLGRPGEGELDIVRHSSSTPVESSPKGPLERLWQLLFVW